MHEFSYTIYLVIGCGWLAINGTTGENILIQNKPDGGYINKKKLKAHAFRGQTLYWFYEEDFQSEDSGALFEVFDGEGI